MEGLGVAFWANAPLRQGAKNLVPFMRCIVAAKAPDGESVRCTPEQRADRIGFLDAHVRW